MTTTTLDVRLSAKGFDCSGLRAVSLSLREAISQPSRIELDLVSDEAVDVEQLIGGEMHLELVRDGSPFRHLHGFVQSVELLPPGRDDSRRSKVALRLTLVSRLLRLLYVKNSQVFVDTDAATIVRNKLSRFRFAEGSDFVFRLDHPVPTREIIIQYRETDFEFVSRLMEQYGLAYFIEQGSEGDRVVISDNPAGFDEYAGDVIYRDRGERLDLFELSYRRELIPKSYICRDYNYRTPNVKLQSERVALDEGDFGGLFEYGGHFTSIDEANARAQIMAQRELAGRDRYSGQSDLPLGPGMKFEVQEHPDSPALMVTEIESSWADTSGGDERSERLDTAQRFRNSFVAIPAGRMFRPPRTTAVPRIDGLVHAVVQTDATGTLATNAKLDSEGRYLIKFRFDPAASDETTPSSCRVRMIQQSAGAGYGTHFPLRPGVEVLVSFIDGNPDRPLIVGAAPNTITPSPVAAVDGNKSRIRTGSGAVIEFDDGS